MFNLYMYKCVYIPMCIGSIYTYVCTGSFPQIQWVVELRSTNS